MGSETVQAWFRSCLAIAQDDAPPTEARPEQPAQVGELELANFQRRAAERGLHIVRAYGGVVLADAVGLGKTRVSLAIARSLVRDARLQSGRPSAVWVCAPARLVRQWREALTRAGVSTFEVLTHTQLSRGQTGPAEPPGAVVVDEAHRFRNPKAKRSQALAKIAQRAPVILATATPVCNSSWDLYHLLSLFLAEHDLRGAVGRNLYEAFELAVSKGGEPKGGKQADFDLTELVEQVVIRRTEPPSRAGFGRRPNVSLEVLRYEAHGQERWLWQNLEAELARMAMELFRADWPRQLLVQYVLKRWESGADALLVTLSKMCDFHRRWLEAHSHGRTLSRKSYRQLFDGEVERRQGVFPFLFDGPGGARKCQKERVDSDLSILEGLDRRARQVAGDKDAKRGAILELVAGDRQKTLVFTSYQHAARGLYEHLVDGLGAQARVGLVTGDGAWATGLGKTSADEVVRRFAPLSNGLIRLDPHQRIDVLVSTDCLSEGVNLQDCGRVVLADLPYSPLGVEQRIGRLVRPGGPHDRVTVYLPRPVAWADSLGMRRRLDRKLADAAGSGAAFVTAAGLSGAGRSQPRQEKRTELASPLAALTRLDALVASLASDNASRAFLEGFWRGEARRGPPRLWARVIVEEEQIRRWLWCLVRKGQQPEMRLSRLISDLVCEVESTSAIRQAEPTTALLRAAKEAVGRRERLLRAARLAPFPLRLDAPQRRVWAALAGHLEAGALSIEAEEISRLRHELLRSFPRGTERRLEEICEADLPAGRLLGQVRRVVGDVPRWSPQVSLRIVAGLELGVERLRG
jgi:superfamily II DNA or RNA helicase